MPLIMRRSQNNLTFPYPGTLMSRFLLCEELKPVRLPRDGLHSLMKKS